MRTRSRMLLARETGMSLRRCSPLLALAVIACASGPSQLYEGPARPREQVALITRAPGGKAWMFAVDSTRVTGDGFWILPGAHSVWVNFQVTRHGGDLTYTIWAYCQIDLEATAGETYVVHSVAAQEHLKGTGVKTVLGARILNAKGVAVAAAQSCSGRRPKLS